MYVSMSLSRKRGAVNDTLARPLGRYVDASVSCHTCWSLVWSRSRYNAMKNAVVGMHKTASVVK